MVGPGSVKERGYWTRADPDAQEAGVVGSRADPDAQEGRGGGIPALSVRWGGVLVR